MGYKRISPMPVIEGGTGIQSATAYAPIVGGTTSTGPFQSASTGISNSGYVLTSNGSAALPSFQPASGGSSGGWVLISTQNLAGTTGFQYNSLSIYATYVAVLTDVVISNASFSCVAQVGFAGNNYVSSAYASGAQIYPYSSSTNSVLSSTIYYVLLPAPTATAPGSSGVVFFKGFNNVNGNKTMIDGNFANYTGSTLNLGFLGGLNTTTLGGSASWDCIEFFNDNVGSPTTPVNFTSGYVSLYGIPS